MVLEDLTLVVPSPVVLEDHTPVVPSPVVLEDLNQGVSEVPIELPNFTAAAIIKKAAFAFHLWAVLHAWAACEYTQELAPVQEPSETNSEPATAQVPSKSTQESTPVWEPSEFTPEPAPESTPVFEFTHELTQVYEFISELAPFYESAPESAQVYEFTPVYESTPELTRVYEFIPELIPVQESAPEPAPGLSGGGFCCRTSAVVPTPKLSDRPITVKEAVAELSVCPVTAIKALCALHCSPA